jgi:hypothetical protein
MEITFNFPHVFSPDSSSEEDAYVLRASLDYLITVDEVFRRYHSVPALYRSGVVYGRTKTWDSIPALYARGYGDCKSLASALIAEYHNMNIPAEPVFRWITRPDGFKDYHILVRGPNGYEDPSKILGMGKDELAPFYE